MGACLGKESSSGEAVSAEEAARRREERAAAAVARAEAEARRGIAPGGAARPREALGPARASGGAGSSREDDRVVAVGNEWARGS